MTETADASTTKVEKAKTSEQLSNNPLYSLSAVYSVLIEYNIPDSLYPFIDRYLLGKVVCRSSGKKRKKFNEGMEGDVPQESTVRMQCINRETLKNLLEEIIGEELAPEIGDFNSALYHPNGRAGKSRWIEGYKRMPGQRKSE